MRCCLHTLAVRHQWMLVRISVICYNRDRWLGIPKLLTNLCQSQSHVPSSEFKQFHRSPIQVLYTQRTRTRDGDGGEQREGE